MTDGKVFFQLSCDQDETQKVLQLKIAERAFVQVCHKETNKLGKPFHFIIYDNSDAKSNQISLLVLKSRIRIVINYMHNTKRINRIPEILFWGFLKYSVWHKLACTITDDGIRHLYQ